MFRTGKNWDNFVCQCRPVNDILTAPAVEWRMNLKCIIHIAVCILIESPGYQSHRGHFSFVKRNNTRIEISWHLPLKQFFTTIYAPGATIIQNIPEAANTVFVLDSRSSSVPGCLNLRLIFKLRFNRVLEMRGCESSIGTFNQEEWH